MTNILTVILTFSLSSSAAFASGSNRFAINSFRTGSYSTVQDNIVSNALTDPLLAFVSLQRTLSKGHPTRKTFGRLLEEDRISRGRPQALVVQMTSWTLTLVLLAAAVPAWAAELMPSAPSRHRTATLAIKRAAQNPASNLTQAELESEFGRMVNRLPDEDLKQLLRLAKHPTPAYTERLRALLPDLANDKMYQLEEKRKGRKYELIIHAVNPSQSQVMLSMRRQKKLFRKALEPGSIVTLMAAINRQMSSMLLEVERQIILHPPRPVPESPFPIGVLGIEIQEGVMIMPDAVAEALDIIGGINTQSGLRAYYADGKAKLMSVDYFLFVRRLRILSPSLTDELARQPNGGMSEINRAYFRPGMIVLLAGSAARPSRVRDYLAHEFFHREVDLLPPADQQILEKAYRLMDNEPFRGAMTALYGSGNYQLMIQDGSFWQEYWPLRYWSDKAESPVMESIHQLMDLLAKTTATLSPEAADVMGKADALVQTLRASAERNADAALVNLRRRLPPVLLPQGAALRARLLVAA